MTIFIHIFYFLQSTFSSRDKIKGKKLPVDSRLTLRFTHEERLNLTFTAYGKRQTAKKKILPFLFSCVYSGVKLFVFAIKSRRLNSIFVWFIYGLEEKNSKAERLSMTLTALPQTTLLLLLSSFLLIRK